jgi:hypothetical protein
MKFLNIFGKEDFIIFQIFYEFKIFYFNIFLIIYLYVFLNKNNKMEIIS